MDNTQAIVSYQDQTGTQLAFTRQDIIHSIFNDVEVSDQELMRVAYTLKQKQMNPFTGDCFIVPYKDKMTGNVKAQITVSADYYKRLARQNPHCLGWEAGVLAFVDKSGMIKEFEGTVYAGTLAGGWARVRYTVDGIDEPQSCYQSVSWGEYKQDNKIWKEKPATMLRKVALMQALREAFPQLAGVYEQDELPKQEPIAQNMPSESYSEPYTYVSEDYEQIPTTEVSDAHTESEIYEF